MKLDNEWKDVQKKDTNNRPSETRNRRKTRKKIINKTSYFLSNSLNKSLNQLLIPFALGEDYSWEDSNYSS